MKHLFAGFVCRTLFYVLAVFVAGLLVPSTNPDLRGPSSAGSQGRALVLSSPFVIALRNSHVKHLDIMCNAAFVISAFSAAVSDGAYLPALIKPQVIGHLTVRAVYISSRFLYYLARCGHAPAFCARIYRSKQTVVPWVGILVCVAFGLLAYMSVSQSSADEVRCR